MKKIVALVLALVMVLGCTAALADTYGLGISSSIGSSKGCLPTARMARPR